MRQLRIGVVGLGLIAQVAHLPNLGRLASLYRVTHISDLSTVLMQSIAAGLPGSPAMSLDWRAVCDDPDVDAVLLLTPGAHAPLALAALDSGKHVISEKPLCITQREARELGRVAAERGLVLQVAYMKAYDPAMPLAREALEQIGPVQLVSVEVRHPPHEQQLAVLDVVAAEGVDMAVIGAARDAEAELIREAIGDPPVAIAEVYQGVLLGSVVHELAAIRALGFEAPGRYDHVAAWPFDPALGGADPPSLAATSRLADGSVLRLQWLWVPHYPLYQESITIVGSRGALHLEMPQPYGPNVVAALRVRTPDGVETQVIDGRHARDSGFLQELRVFHEAVVNGGPMPTGADVARADVASLQGFAVTLAAEYGITLGGEAVALPAT